jgi:hypothetical protein
MTLPIRQPSHPTFSRLFFSVATGAELPVVVVAFLVVRQAAAGKTVAPARELWWPARGRCGKSGLQARLRGAIVWEFGRNAFTVATGMDLPAVRGWIGSARCIASDPPGGRRARSAQR